MTDDMFEVGFQPENPEEKMEFDDVGQDTADDGTMRAFDTGATRGTSEGKLDFDGFLSPCALERYAEYMNSHRKQADGKLRTSDNWQKGITVVSYMKSMWRHFFDLWKLHRGFIVRDHIDGHNVSKEEALCAVIFNSMGYLHVLTHKQVAPLKRHDINPSDPRRAR